ncbi:GntR family transcriptional regulator [Tichowtungia aerotolerans]|uniref:FCD domain-containing protein n=1 Tax=Tichowtungia aerotolerans TaxID=2697043 RepID=A0A6P1M2N5_9BACT|nr:GntR family transcriptional regulator [Tichowtungia aerotolerans]QHI69099.1 FCD domain-containing protein [Tichowtungia aerotolerans]
MAGAMKKEAYQFILQKMVRGELLPGMQISELSIAAELGVSRSPVRDALSQMVSEGMVERVPRYGTVIKQYSAQELANLYDLRVALESYAAAQAAQKITPEMLERLEEACERINAIAQELKKSGNGQITPEMLSEMFKQDMNFHLIILRATGNQLLLKSAYESRLMTRIFGTSRIESFDLEHVAGVYRFHCEVLKAIKQGDAEMARVTMARHISSGKEGALKFVAEHQLHQEREAFDDIAETIISSAGEI